MRRIGGPALTMPPRSPIGKETGATPPGFHEAYGVVTCRIESIPSNARVVVASPVSV
jgi:hypothetical protein